MINKKKLVIFSYEYPYGHGEGFLHNEIQTLKEAFSEIIIVPSRRVWNRNLEHKHVRGLPSNVTLFKESFSFRYVSLGLFIRMLVIPFQTPFKYNLKNGFAVLKQSFKISTLIGFIRHHQLILSDTMYYSYWKNESATALAYLKYKKKIDCALTRAHGEDLYLEFRGLKPFDPFVSKTISKVYCISEDGQNYLLKKGYAKDKIKVSRLGVYPTGSCTLYSRQGLCILSVANIKPVKRVTLIAKAVLKLNMKVRWVHIGDGEEFDEVKKIVDTNTRDNVTIELLGNQPNEFVYDFYRDNQVDLFLNVSSSEGLPVSIMEAYSFSVPCMACNVGGNQEIIDPNGDFLLSPQINENELSLAITNFYNKKDLWTDFRKEAFHIWETEYNAIQNYRNFSKSLLVEKC
ncbi:glycosyltransferase [Cyclobacterium jeungdonense]|uniref:Glycosyltransferase n=1 Tax=Cyclobacterium jeungdonense TaxID=708087 RepID=A0ABT8C206_9BACT|nr:glycosyltransferase [Cyclobacterium jeungdonense]MDN3686525.1 glycosyltransferase [Cyclobacterium jeungdonense]